VNHPDPEAFGELEAVAPAAEPPEAEGPARQPPLARPHRATEPVARHLSYSSLASYGRCGYRFYVERVVGISRAGRDPDSEDGELAPRERRYGFGNAVHAMLEWSARHGWREPAAELCRDLLRRERLDAGGEIDRARAMVAGWLASDLCAELRGNEGVVRPEMPFILPLGDSVVRGTIDLLATTPTGPLVVDYKTDSLADAEPAELVDRYGVQRSVYALAASAGGADRVRAAYVFLERPGEPVVEELDSSRLSTARNEVERLIGDIKSGRFEVTDRPHRALCWDCPARARLCSHPLEFTGRRLP
jgi:ATP-dependent exoDNAse (exonuclease V) beta subunit